MGGTTTALGISDGGRFADVDKEVAAADAVDVIGREEAPPKVNDSEGGGGGGGEINVGGIAVVAVVVVVEGT